ncbi:MAG TPA: hypothetical protein VFN55_04570 [Solirubrobacteraceae bacterium]|nr:hypothetical protein [Solirubrobacteraceae bacterium]
MAVTIQHHPAGITAHETTGLGRAMHALRDGDRTWLIDPFHAAEFRDSLSELPPLAGVIQLLDRHNRDCSEIAGSFDIPLHRVPRAVPDSELEVIPVVERRIWHEVALWAPQTRALVIAESVGTAPLFGLGRPAGMHPMQRFMPPRRALSGHAPELLLVGHGPALQTGAAAALAGALDHARGDLPRLITRLPSVLHRS